MPPKNKKTKAEEALAFLSDLDNFDAPPPPTSTESPVQLQSATQSNPAVTSVKSSSTPRASTDSTRPKVEVVPQSSEGGAASGGDGVGGDEEAASALAFLEAQLSQKRAPLSVGTSTPRSSTPLPSASNTKQIQQVEEEINIPTSPPKSTGWGVSSFWSTASSAISAAQKVADEGYKRVRTEGVEGLGGVGIDVGRLRKEAEERLGGYVKGVDLEKLRHDLVSTTTSTLTNILNTVAPPISAHETLELWLSHPMVGYAGVEGVIYRAWMRILEQTESGEVIIIWSPPVFTSTTEGGADSKADINENEGERSINPVEGWSKGWERAEKEMEAVKGREKLDPQGRARISPNNPVTTIPIFLHLQPLLAPLPLPEPPLLLSSPNHPAGSPLPRHLHFLITLHDPAHSLRFTGVTQGVPSDWLEVRYEESDWVEERLVDVLRVGVEVVAQDYVATRMGLKNSETRPQTPAPKEEIKPEANAAEEIAAAVATA